MSISSSLYSGISGLSTLGNSMAVIGDNIANVNTVAFKSSRATFQDLLSQNVSVAGGTSQVGRGVRLSNIAATFAQGSFENTSEATDLAIGGAGFFMVNDAGTGDQYYTRAGQFSFDQTGYLVNPEDYVVQGWALDPNTGQDIGAITDILLTSFSSPPQATTLMQMSTNLDSRAPLEMAPGTPLSASWDAANNPPIGATSYEYQTSMSINDSVGSQHTLTLYFDRTSTANEYEFLLTSDPALDVNAAAKGAMAGVYLRGTILYDTGGNMTDFVSLETKDPAGAATWTNIAGGASLGTNNYPAFTVDFGQGPQAIELNLGLLWDLGSGTWIRDSNYTSTQYASTPTTISQAQNGYGPGFLQSVTVGTDGVMEGRYSNGQVTPLFRVALANFNNPWELTKKGGNLYAENQRTGAPTTGHPGSNGLGSIASNALEQSNVDLADQFVKMITIQRGFQANSRIITTTDTMMQELINLKR
jgi:flagellar hook protein FlgE